MVWQEDLTRLEQRWNEAMLSGPQDSHLKRKIYVDLELLRLEHLNPHSPQEEVAQFDKLRARMDIPIKKRTSLGMYFRLLCSVIYIFAAVPWLLLFLPLRLLHPVLRQLGVANNNLPVDLCQRYFASGLLASCGVEVRWQGLENFDLSHNTLGMFSHVSNLDAFCLSSGPVSFKWVGKKSAFYLPIIGWLAYAWGHIPIDRSNLEAARSSLASAVAQIKEFGRSLGVSPEGTRSRSGRLLDFKKGPFHMALALQIPITIMLIDGAFDLWPPGQLFTSTGTVVVRVLPPTSVKEGETVEELSKRIRRTFLEGYAQECKQPPRALSSWLVEVLRLPMMFVVTWILLQMFS